MEQATTIGLDIAKQVFQLHRADAAGHVLFRKRITRVKLLGFLAAQTRCVVAMEACAGAHYWARECTGMPALESISGSPTPNNCSTCGEPTAPVAKITSHAAWTRSVEALGPPLREYSTPIARLPSNRTRCTNSLVTICQIGAL
jgi:hypothetical protein